MIHDFYLNRIYAVQAIPAMQHVASRMSQAGRHISLLAIGRMSVRTMSEQDKAEVVTRDSERFLFFLQDFEDIDEASRFMDAFMEAVDAEEEA